MTKGRVLFGIAAAGLLAALIAGPLSPGGSGSDSDTTEDAAASLPLGPDSLEETRTEREVAPGVLHVSIERGSASAEDFWTVTLAVTSDEQQILDLEGAVRDLGHTPRRDLTAGPDPRRPDDGPLATVLRVGRYADQEQADRLREELAAAGISGQVQFTGEDGLPTTGPWSLDALVIDPGVFGGRVEAELAEQSVRGTEPVSSIAARTGALAAINGGFFVLADARSRPGPWVAGVEGDVGGISVLEGELISEAVNGRPALVLPKTSGRDASVERVATSGLVTTGEGAEHKITGINRRAGLVLNCGGTGDSTPSVPIHDYTCAHPDELIAITAAFGATLPEGTGYQLVLDDTGRVIEAGEGLGGRFPPTGTVLQGTGSGAAWLRAHAEAGDRLTLRHDVRNADTGESLPVSAQTQLVNGGPLLLRDGTLALDPVRDGWSPKSVEGHDRTHFYNDWYLRRNPRTAAGITADGRIILLTADGRSPEHSLGLSIPELAEVMRSLGAVDALNLDGGGSTMMVVGSEPQVRPSDANGERPIADALVLLPGPDS